MMGTEIFKIDASWAEKLTKTRVSFLSAPTVDVMPGFRLNWYYIGLDRNLEVANYVNDGPTKSFVRSSIIIIR